MAMSLTMPNQSRAPSNFFPPNEGCVLPKATCICLVDDTVQFLNQKKENISLEKMKKATYKLPRVSPRLLGWIKY